jgi:hypothetical protein
MIKAFRLIEEQERAVHVPPQKVFIGTLVGRTPVTAPVEFSP